MHLPVVLACHDIVIVLPVLRFLQVFLDLHHFFEWFPHLLYNLHLLNNLWILWLREKRYVLRLLLDSLIKELLVESMILVVIFAVGY